MLLQKTTGLSIFGYSFLLSQGAVFIGCIIFINVYMKQKKYNNLVQKIHKKLRTKGGKKDEVWSKAAFMAQSRMEIVISSWLFSVTKMMVSLLTKISFPKYTWAISTPLFLSKRISAIWISRPTAKFDWNVHQECGYWFSSPH